MIRQSGRILLVESEHDDERQILCLLERANLANRVTVVRDGLEALSTLRHEERPALVLVDLSLPTVDGVALIEALRMEPATADLAVAALTGSDEEERLVRLHFGHQYPTVRKPLTVHGLCDAISKLGVGWLVVKPVEVGAGV